MLLESHRNSKAAAVRSAVHDSLGAVKEYALSCAYVAALKHIALHSENSQCCILVAAFFKEEFCSALVVEAAHFDSFVHLHAEVYRVHDYLGYCRYYLCGSCRSYAHEGLALSVQNYCRAH